MYLVAKLGRGYTPSLNNGGEAFKKSYDTTQRVVQGFYESAQFLLHWERLWQDAFQYGGRSIVGDRPKLHFNGLPLATSADERVVRLLTAPNRSPPVRIVTRELSQGRLLQIAGGFMIPDMWGLDVSSEEGLLGVSVEFPSTHSGSSCGVAERDFTLAGNSFRLFTYWLNTSGIKDGRAGTHHQILISAVDSLSANGMIVPFTSSTLGSYSPTQRLSISFPSGRGCIFLSSPRTTVQAHQDAVLADLEFLTAAMPATSTIYPLTPHRDVGLYPLDGVHTTDSMSGRVVDPRYCLIAPTEAVTHVNAQGIYTQGGLTKAGYGGGAEISGVVLREGVPVQRRVRLYVRETGGLVASVLSNASGQYKFTNLDPAERYYVMSFDNEQVYNAVIEDNIRP